MRCWQPGYTWKYISMLWQKKFFSRGLCWRLGTDRRVMGCWASLFAEIVIQTHIASMLSACIVVSVRDAAVWGAGSSLPPVAQSDNAVGGNVGTWNGPRPRGYAVRASEASNATTAPTVNRKSGFVPLPGGGKMPMIGFGTYGVPSADVVTCALTLDCTLWIALSECIGGGFMQSMHLWTNSTT